QLVGSANDPPKQAQRHVARYIGIGAARLVGQHPLQFLAHVPLVQKSAPKGYPSIGAQPLVSKANPNRLCCLGRANLDHRLVSAACVWLSWFFHFKHSFNPQHHQTPSESSRWRRGVRGEEAISTSVHRESDVFVTRIGR